MNTATKNYNRLNEVFDLVEVGRKAVQPITDIQRTNLENLAKRVFTKEKKDQMYLMEMQFGIMDDLKCNQYRAMQGADKMVDYGIVSKTGNLIKLIK